MSVDAVPVGDESLVADLSAPPPDGASTPEPSAPATTDTTLSEEVSQEEQQLEQEDPTLVAQLEQQEQVEQFERTLTSPPTSP